MTTTSGTSAEASTADDEPRPSRSSSDPRPPDDTDGDRAPENRTLGSDSVASADPDEWETVRSGNTVPEPDVTEMFDSIARVYDRMNTFMTLGVDSRWRRLACQAAELQPGDSVVDAACGTGKLSALMAAEVGPFGRVEGVDLSSRMIARAERRYHSLVQLNFRVGNALALPFEDDQFDAATIAFGLRNLSDFNGGLTELARVVKPGGRVVCLELSLPRSRVWARLFHGTLRRTAPVAASLFGARRAAYSYLPASLDGFPRPEHLADTMRAVGLADVKFWQLSTGVVALHRGYVVR